MKELKLSRHERMLFELLRASLHERETERLLFRDCSETEWKECRRIAVAQGVMALAWDGVVKLPAELQPPKSIRLAWALAVEQYEKRYRYYCKTVCELSRFYSQHGISMMQMKGVGLSAIYPVPSHREGGDLDIYTYSADREHMSDEDANRLADELMHRQSIDVQLDKTPKHSNFYYNGIPVENHKYFLSLGMVPAAEEAEAALKSNMNVVETSLGVGSVLTPSPLFNTLFVAFHAAQHLCSGLALHHLCDWACILKNYGGRMPESITDRRFLRFVSALTLLSNRLLGTSVTVGNAPEDLAHTILKEILRPSFEAEISATNKIGIVFYKTRRMIRRNIIRQEVLGVSALKATLASVSEHILHPKYIFVT